MNQGDDDGDFGAEDEIEPKNKTQKVEDSSRSITSSEKEDAQVPQPEVKKVEQGEKAEMKVRVNFQGENTFQINR